MNFVEVIRKDLEEKANEQKVKLAVQLTGEAARKFQELHRTLSQQQELSAGQLASRLLALALQIHEEPRRRRKGASDQEMPSS